MKRPGKRPVQARAAERNRRVQFTMHIGQGEVEPQRDLVDSQQRDTSQREETSFDPVDRTRLFV